MLLPPRPGAPAADRPAASGRSGPIPAGATTPPIATTTVRSACPIAASHERLWRDDHLYDLVVVLDYNLAGPRPGAGSAIFLHLAAPGFAPTAGCVAVIRRMRSAGCSPAPGLQTELIVA